MLNIILGAISLGLLWAVMTIGVYITYRILDIADLTVEGSITTGAAITAHLITNGTNPYIALIMAMFGGMIAGLITGLLHTQLKIPVLLSGILTMIALYSINLRIMGRATVSLLRIDTVFSPLINMGLSRINAAIVLGLICVLFIICILYWFFGTEVGCAIRATGNNPHMARAQGINTDVIKILGLIISNGLVAISGGLIAQNQSFSDIQMGAGTIVIGLASVIIGEVLFSRKNFSSKLIALMLGAIAYRIIIALVLRMGMHANDLKLFTALTVALALALPVFKDRIHSRKISIKEDD